VAIRKQLPAVTVAIPAYNCAGTLQRAIDSVLAQTHGDFELLIVDDGSKDGTAEILARQSDPRIRVLRHDRNQGEGGARNTCFRAASHPWLAFLDSDDEWFPGKLRVQLEALAGLREECCVVLVPYELYNLDNGRRETICETAAGEGGDWLRYFLDQCGVGAGTTMLASKASFERAGSYDARLLRRTDHDWLLRFAAKGGTIVQLEGAPLARVYFTAKSRPEAIQKSTEMFLEKHQALFAAQPPAVARRARATLLFQVAEICEVNRRHFEWLKTMGRCFRLDPGRTIIEVMGRVHRAAGRPLSRWRGFKPLAGE